MNKNDIINKLQGLVLALQELETPKEISFIYIARTEEIKIKIEV